MTEVLLEEELRPLEEKRTVVAGELEGLLVAAAAKRSQIKLLDGVLRKAGLLDTPVKVQADGALWISDEMVDLIREATRKQDGDFTVKQIVQETGVSEATVRKGLKVLQALGEVRDVPKRIPDGNVSAQPAAHFEVGENGSATGELEVIQDTLAEIQKALKPMVKLRERLVAELEEIENGVAERREVAKTIERVFRLVRGSGSNGSERPRKRRKQLRGVSKKSWERAWVAVQELAPDPFTVRHVSEAAQMSDLTLVKRCLEVFKAEKRIRRLAPRVPKGNRGGVKAAHYALIGG